VHRLEKAGIHGVLEFALQATRICSWPPSRTVPSRTVPDNRQQTIAPAGIDLPTTRNTGPKIPIKNCASSNRQRGTQRVKSSGLGRGEIDFWAGGLFACRCTATPSRYWSMEAWEREVRQDAQNFQKRGKPSYLPTTLAYWGNLGGSTVMALGIRAGGIEEPAISKKPCGWPPA